MASKSLDDGNTVAFENPQYGNRTTGVKVNFSALVTLYTQWP